MSAQPKATDTICVLVPTYQSLVTKAKQKEVLQERVSILTARIDTLQGIIRELEIKDAATVDGYKSELKVTQEELRIYQDQVETYEKALRREKRRRFFTAVGGTLATGAALYLYITK